MVLGTVVTYIVSPSGNAVLLFVGVAIAFTAVCTAAVMHRFKEQQQNVARKVQLQEDTESGVSWTNRSNSVARPEPSMTRKLLVCIIGGILLGLWNPLVTLAEKDPHGLTPFGEFVFYTAAVFLSSLVLVPLVIVFPLEGGRGDSVGEVFSKWP